MISPLNGSAVLFVFKVPSQNNEQELIIPLQKNHDTLSQLQNEKLFQDYNQLQKISISILRKFYEMYMCQKSNKSKDNSDIKIQHQNLKQVISFLRNVDLTHLTSFEYNNEDLTFNPLEEIFELLSFAKNLKNITFTSQALLQISQYNSFIDNVGQQRSLQQLKTNIQLKKGEVAKYKGSSFKYLNSFVLGTVTQDIQQCLIMKNFPSLQKLEVKLIDLTEKDIDVFFALLPKYNEQLLEVKVEIKQYLKNGRMCLQHIEKIKLLQVLHLKIMNNPLSKKDLNIQNLPHLKDLFLACEEPLNFLLSFPKVSISEVTLINNGISSNQLESQKTIFEINRFEYSFSCKKKQHIANVLSELEIIKGIVDQLEEIKLIFSQCQQFVQEEFDKQVILKLGELFKECSKEVKINLVTTQCLFSTNARFLLGWQFRHFKRFSNFILNDVNIYEEVMKYENEKQITFELMKNTTIPYLLTGLSATNLCQNKIIHFDCAQLFECKNANLIKKNEFLKEMFENFVRVELNLYSLDRNLLNPFLKSFCSDSIIYIDIASYQARLGEINGLVNTFKCLQVVCLRVDHVGYFLERNNVISERGIQIKIILEGYYFDYNLIRKLMKIDNHFLDLIFRYGFNYTHEQFAFELIPQLIQQENLHIQILDPIIFREYFKVINEMQNEICSQKMKLNIYENLIEQFIPINPNMVYTDLLID